MAHFELEEVFEYISELKVLMGLKDWEFSLTDESHLESPQDDYITQGQIQVIYGQKRAMIEINPDWRQWTANEFRHIIVHELVHCHLEPIRWGINNTASLHSANGWIQFEGHFMDTIEMATDGIASAWAARLPLIMEWKDDE